MDSQGHCQAPARLGMMGYLEEATKALGQGESGASIEQILKFIQEKHHPTATEILKFPATLEVALELGLVLRLDNNRYSWSTQLDTLCNFCDKIDLKSSTKKKRQTGKQGKSRSSKRVRLDLSGLKKSHRKKNESRSESRRSKSGSQSKSPATPKSGSKRPRSSRSTKDNC